MIVIDASVWISVLVSEDVHHAESGAWLESAYLDQVVFAVPAHFPAEIIGVLRRIHHPESILEEVFDMIGKSDIFSIHPVSVELGMVAAVAARTTAVRGADAVYLALAAELGIALVTWDRQQRERGAVFCRTMTPVEAMELYR